MSEGFVIAIDGPVGGGKGTIAKLLAQRLDGFHLYTGAMYRALALEAIRKGTRLDNEKEIAGILPKVSIKFSGNKVLLGDEDVTERIQRQDVAEGSAEVAAIPEVRRHMVKMQQEIADEFIKKGKVVVAEGRDTGTVVFPDAKLKVFLTATPEVRARRRLKQLKTEGSEADFKKILAETKTRDEKDLQREVDPLVSDPENYGYFVLDNTQLSEEETLERIIEKLGND